MTKDAEWCRLQQRRAALLCSARALFIEQGYERTTLHQVVLRAGGSLATVYKLFGSKEGLLEAVVVDKMLPATAVVREHAATDNPPDVILREIGEALHARFLNPEDIALTRLVIARSMEDRAFARRFFDTKASLTQVALTDLFQRWKDEGVAMRGEPSVLAEVYFGLIINDLQQQAISHGTVAAASATDIQCRIDFFMRGAGMAVSEHEPG